MMLTHRCRLLPPKYAGMLFRSCVAALLCFLAVRCDAASQASQAADAAFTTRSQSRDPGAIQARRRAVPSDRGRKSKRILPANEPASPSTIGLKDGVLSIEANNSDLREILQQVADASGMVIVGSVESARVYGSYGPSDAREVLTSLLTGSGYNFLMSGVTRLGAPRELRLTPQSGVATPPSQPPGAAPAIATSGNPQQPEVNGDEELPPGVIAHAPPPPPEDPAQRVQQNLNRLQQMRDPQNQQNTPK